MKKIAFALQLFTLITMFPLYVIIELNHTTGAPNGNETVAEVSRNVKVISTIYPQTQGYNENLISPDSDKNILPTDTFSLAKN